MGSSISKLTHRVDASCEPLALSVCPDCTAEGFGLRVVQPDILCGTVRFRLLLRRPLSRQGSVPQGTCDGDGVEDALFAPR